MLHSTQAFRQNNQLFVRLIMSQAQKPVEKPNEKDVATENRNNDSTNQYQIRPTDGKSFPIGSIREIINEVLLQTLDGE